MLNKLIIILSLLLGSQVWAQSSNDFCRELVEKNLEANEAPKAAQKKMRFGKQFSLIFNVLFTPNNMITMNTLSLNPEGLQTASSEEVQGNKYAFLLIKEAVISKAESKKLKKLKKSLKVRQKKIKESLFSKNLKVIKNVSECHKLVEENPTEYNQIIQFSDDITKAQPRFKKKQEAALYKMAMAKMKFLKRKGWKVIKNTTFYKANQIMNKDASAALFITHSTKSGKLLDANANILPKSFFKAIPKSVSKVIMYSCHSKAVIDYYEINIPSRSYEYHYPTVKKQFQFLFNDTIPLISLKKIKKSLKSQVKNFSPKKTCPLTVNSNHMNDGYNVYLNRDYIGSLENTKTTQTLDIDCDLIKGTNYINIYRTKDTKLDTSGDKFHSISLNQILNGDLSNHYSRVNNNHIVSKIKLEKNLTEE